MRSHPVGAKTARSVKKATIIAGNRLRGNVICGRNGVTGAAKRTDKRGGEHCPACEIACVMKPRLSTPCAAFCFAVWDFNRDDALPLLGWFRLAFDHSWRQVSAGRYTCQTSEWVIAHVNADCSHSHPNQTTILMQLHGACFKNLKPMGCCSRCLLCAVLSKFFFFPWDFWFFRAQIDFLISSFHSFYSS